MIGLVKLLISGQPILISIIIASKSLKPHIIN